MVMTEIAVAEVIVAEVADWEILQLVSQGQQPYILMPQGSDEVLPGVLRDAGLEPVGEDLSHGPPVEGEVPVCAGVDERSTHFRVKLLGQVPGCYLLDLTVVHSLQQCCVDRLA